MVPVPPNVPMLHTSFIGRKREIAEIVQLLTSSPVVTLVGSGGCGKTRIALRVAADVSHQYADGVFWCELAQVADPALVPQVVAKTLQAVELPDASLMDAVLNRLRGRHILLVLDNCEHLLEACAQLIETLVSVLEARVLVTSREGLGIRSEALYPVLPLAVPSVEKMYPDIAAFEAVQLFVERARSILPGFVLTPENAHVVASICHDLDGIPLAIELASARVNVLHVQQIHARLNHRLDVLVSRSRGDRRAFVAAGLDVMHEAEGLMGRGLYLGTRPLA
jgi:predicted ATPase